MTLRSILYLTQTALGDRSSGIHTISFGEPQYVKSFVTLATQVITNSKYNYRQGFVNPTILPSANNSAVLESHDMASIEDYLKCSGVYAKFTDFLRNSTPLEINNNQVYTIPLLHRDIFEGFTTSLSKASGLDLIEGRTFEHIDHNGTPRVEISEISKGPCKHQIRLNLAAHNVLSNFSDSILASYKSDPAPSTSR